MADRSLLIKTEMKGIGFTDHQVQSCQRVSVPDTFAGMSDTLTVWQKAIVAAVHASHPPTSPSSPKVKKPFVGPLYLKNVRRGG